MRYMKALMTLIGFLAEVAVSRDAATSLGPKSNEDLGSTFPFEG